MPFADRFPSKMDADSLPPELENVVESGQVVVENGHVAESVASPDLNIKRKPKRVERQNSKEKVSTTNHLPQFRNWKNSRRPRNGHNRGLPKKGGAGGKGVWGLPGSEVFEELEEDTNDPNYDPEALTNGDIEFKQVIIEAEPEEVVKKSEPVILEYFEHGDTNEAAESFQEFVTSKRGYLVCESIVEIAMDHKPSHCEMASVLISDLYGRVFSAKDIAYAFERLLDRMPDLLLDTPDGVTLLSNFIARAVADDCIPPRFVTSQKERNDLNTPAKQTIQRADTLLSMKNGLVRLDTVWGVGGGLRPVKALVRQMNLLIKEFLSSGDVIEAERCLRDLEVPHFHHELVYETVVMALEAVNATVEEQLCRLLGELYRTVLVTPEQMDRGFLRVLEDMSDIVLDVPLAYIMLDRFVERCTKRFPLGEAVLARMPTRGRKRYVSEGDGGHIKDHVFKLRE